MINKKLNHKLLNHLITKNEHLFKNKNKINYISN